MKIKEAIGKVVAGIHLGEYEMVSVMNESNTASRARPSVMPSAARWSWAVAAAAAITQTSVIITENRVIEDMTAAGAPAAGSTDYTEYTDAATRHLRAKSASISVRYSPRNERG